jgi:hypothetical protein
MLRHLKDNQGRTTVWVLLGTAILAAMGFLLLLSVLDTSGEVSGSITDTLKNAWDSIVQFFNPEPTL